MFPGSVIRKLAHSEEVFAANETYFALTVQISGPVDIEALSDAFDAVLQSHPIFAGHLEKADDGRHQIVAEDLMHTGIWVVDDRTSEAALAGMQLDQNQSLLNLRLKISGDHSELTLYAHHSLADAHHVFGLLEEFFSRYTDAVETGDAGPVARPTRARTAGGVARTARRDQAGSGPASNGFSRRHSPTTCPPSEKPPVASIPIRFNIIPAARIRFSEEETSDLVEFGLANQLSLNSVVAAAILLTEWELRNTPHLPIPYVYPVDVRYLLTPPVSATGSTLPLGMASYLAEIGPDTELVDVAHGIVDAFRADLAEGLIQQSLAAFQPAIRRRPARASAVRDVHRRRFDPRGAHSRATWKYWTFKANCTSPPAPPSTSTAAGILPAGCSSSTMHTSGTRKVLGGSAIRCYRRFPKRTAGSWSDQPGAHKGR